MIGTDLLELINDRKALLSYLADGPAHKRDIVDDMDLSRSTVDRAVSELMDYRLVQRKNDGYEVSKKGEIALGEITRTHEAMVGLEEASELVDCLPSGVGVPPSLFEEGDVYLSGQTSPLSPIDLALNRAKECEKLITLSYSYTHPSHGDVLLERVFDGELELELVFEETLADDMIEKYGEYIDEYLDSDNVAFWVSSDIQFALFVYYMEDTEYLHLDAHGPNGDFRGTIESTSKVAIRWAENYFENIVDSSTPIAELV